MAEAADYTAGIVHYRNAPGLAECLASLRSQTLQPAKIVVVNHSGCPEDLEELRAAYDDVEWIFAENGGYAGGANRIITRCGELRPDAGFVLLLNSDVTLEPEFSAELLRETLHRPDVVLASGKLLRPGGGLIDSAGIVMRRSRRFFDRGSEEPDDGRYGAVESVFAVSGAAMLLRRSGLSALAIDGEVFDEDFFIYHEDTDLSWRARQLGYDCLYVPQARATHVRGWRREGRSRIPPKIRRHSFKNRYLELIKNERPLDLLRNLPFILTAEMARLGFALLADRTVLAGYLDAASHARRAWRKRRVIHRKVSAAVDSRGKRRAAGEAGSTSGSSEI